MRRRAASATDRRPCALAPDGAPSLLTGRLRYFVRAQVVEYSLSADLSTVAVLTDEGGESTLRVHKAGEKPAEEDDDEEEIE